MKRFGLFIFFLSILLALILFVLVEKKQEFIETEKASAPYTVEYVKNLIYNSSFEVGRGDKADGWIFIGSSEKEF